MRTTAIELYEGKGRFGANEHPTGEPMHSDWACAVWSEPDLFDGDSDRRIFGLTYYGRPTHMAYRLDEYFDPCEVVVRLDQPGHGRFYFDAGGNGRPIWAERDALAHAFDILGLIPRDWPEPVGADNQATNTLETHDA